MKKLIATIAIALMAMSANAETTNNKIKMCTGLSNLSGSIARAHQEGVELTQMLGDDVLSRHSELIIAIYSDNTRYSSKSLRERVVTDTKNRVMLACLKRGS